MTKYEIILYWSDEDQAFIAEVPELSGCAADGATRQEARAAYFTPERGCNWGRFHVSNLPARTLRRFILPRTALP